MRLSVAIVLLFTPGTLLSAQSDESMRWHYIGSSTDVMWEIDVASVRQRSADVNQLWVRTSFTPPKRLLPSPAAPASFMLTRTEVDCSERRFRVLDALAYGRKKSLVSSMPHQDDPSWEYPPPSSLGERLVNLCETPYLLDGSFYREMKADADKEEAVYSERVARCESVREEPAVSLCRRWKAAKARPKAKLLPLAALVDSVDEALGIPHRILPR